MALQLIINQRDKQPEFGKVTAGPIPLKMLCSRVPRFLGERADELFDALPDAFCEVAEACAEQSKKVEFFDALKLLRAQRQAITQAWIEAIEQGFHALGATVPGDEAKGEVLQIGDAALAPPEENIEEMIALDMMVSATTANNNMILRTLCSRMQRLVGPTVDMISLPISPENVATHFAATLRPCNLPLQPRLAFLWLFEKLVLKKLAPLLEQSSGLLADLDIKVEAAQVKPAVQRRPKSPLGAPSSVDSPQVKGRFQVLSALDVPRATGQRLPNQNSERFVDANTLLLLSHKNSAAGKAVNSLAVDQQHGKLLSRGELLAMLERVKPKACLSAASGVDHATGRRPGGIDALTVKHQIERFLHSKGCLLGELEVSALRTIDLVDGLFHEIFTTSALPGALHPLFARLAMPVARFTLANPSIFERQQHPLRRILNEMAAAGCMLHGVEDLTADPLHQKLDEIATQLEQAMADSSRLPQLLADLVKFWEVEKRRIGVIDLQTIATAECGERNIAARHCVQQALADRLVGKEFAYAVVLFAERVWSGWLFNVARRYGPDSKEWIDAIGLLDQLLRYETSGELDQDSLAVVLDSIRATLARCKGSAACSGAIVDGIHRYYTQDKKKRENIHPLVFARQDAEGAGDLTLRILVDTLDLKIPENYSRDEDENLDQVDNDAFLELDSIARGSWVQWQPEDGRLAVRYRLLGTLKPSGDFVFGDRHGKKLAVKSPHCLAQKINKGCLTVLETTSIFDDALARIVCEYAQ